MKKLGNLIHKVTIHEKQLSRRNFFSYKWSTKINGDGSSHYTCRVFAVIVRTGETKVRSSSGILAIEIAIGFRRWDRCCKMENNTPLTWHFLNLSQSENEEWTPPTQIWQKYPNFRSDPAVVKHIKSREVFTGTVIFSGIFRDGPYIRFSLKVWGELESQPVSLRELLFIGIGEKLGPVCWWWTVTNLVFVVLNITS